MDKPSGILESWRDLAIERLSTHLTERYGAQLITNEETLAKYRAFRAWALTLDVGGNSLPAYFTVDSQFPFSLPKLLLTDSVALGKLAHVSDDGVICVLPSSASVTHRHPEGVADFIINEAKGCLSDSLAQSHPEDFIDEFDAYWHELAGSEKWQAISLVEAHAPARQVYAYVINGRVIFAESVDDLERWLTNAGWSTPRYRSEYIPAPFAWLDQAVPACEFPSTNREAKEFFETHAASVSELLTQLIPQDAQSLPILIGMPTANGPALATIVLQEPKATGKPGSGKLRTFKRDGFRKSTKIPPAVLADRYLQSVPLRRLITMRADSAWHGHRAGSTFSNSLSSKTVCFVGCGALGSHVAAQLARSGISKLTLIDGETLEYNNIGRHLLGAEYVGQFKEVALQRFLAKQLPHLTFECHPGKKWQDILALHPQSILEADVIVSTTGSWACDDALNLVVRSISEAPPLVFGWLEQFGCAGQCLAVVGSGGCLRCGTDELGNFSQAAAAFPSDTLLPSGPCGQLFQPFGVAEVLPVQAAVVGTVVKCLMGDIPSSKLTTWIGDKNQLKEFGGTWTSAVPDGHSGNSYVHRDWSRSADCILCGDKNDAST